MAMFFDYLKNDDPRVAFLEENTPGRQNGLYTYFRNLADLVGEFRKKEQSWHYLLQNTIEHTSVGIIVFDENFKTEIVNRSASLILGVNNISNINSVDEIHSGLSFTLRNILPGQKKIIKSHSQGEIRELLIRSDEFKLFDKKLKLISITDIRPEMEDNEMESWHKLIRVLSHEITNTVSPLSSISRLVRDDINSYISNRKDVDIDCKPVMDETLTGLELIDDRVNGLLKFVREFRSITIPPQISPIYYPVSDSLKKLSLLFREELNDKQISFNWRCDPENLTVFADIHLIEQVLINLCRNAVEALATNEKSDKSININCSRENDITVIEVADNGPGIPENYREKIFIPFFTTKSKGSGIGLSLSRMILRKHNGILSFYTDNTGTKFKLKF
jgi:nitrogen fixation/metabolism regulation signal transduction histidine kinase